MKKLKMTTTAIGLSALLTGCFPYTVDEGEVALVTKYGEIIETKTSGLGWSSMLEDVTHFSIREQKQVFGKFDENGDVVGGFAAYTRDTQTVTTGLTVTYKLTDPVKAYKLYRTTENMVNQLVEPRTRQAIEIVFSQYSAQQALENRAKLTTDITQAVREAVKNYPIEITAVQSIIQFNKEYEKRVEESVQKNVAIQTAERQVAIDRKEAESRLVKAQAEADAEIIRAKADAEKVRLAGEAEAAAIRAKGEALKENRQLVELTAAEKWNGVLPTTMTPSGSLPFVQVGGK
ncbi:Regulator of protease activity HflC, stomatin/prohibitin superfamily [Pasteurella testudinis DSM 23072]|uniref:Regulator of protease activity HflC, stomatin/prohibitin superfamily n=1 Tax=Pasteurella testudinis DSM 23072 TaxID=1122938 RepID=A0A1W1V6D4_9PAST|nr:prohibitin family protein [Pasteurella testudinis]SMB88621.1 Regulator of protease activity HflC, stomatin/prohibitin superfamily [Pasteurella testudinis DSM 23072]SUB51584.1 FtsH protease regulator HflK [Pasteurella testudinis]